MHYDILAWIAFETYTNGMKLFGFILILTLLITFAPAATAFDCSSIPTKNKIILKLSDIQDSVWLFFLMDPRKQIPYRLMRANALYTQSADSTDDNLAYTYALRGEDHMTRLVTLIRTLSNTQPLNIRALEQSVQTHIDLISREKSPCDWQTLKQFIQNNHDIMQQLYYLRLPTDTNMQLLKGNQTP